MTKFNYNSGLWKSVNDSIPHHISCQSRTHILGLREWTCKYGKYKGHDDGDDERALCFVCKRCDVTSFSRVHSTFSIC